MSDGPRLTDHALSRLRERGSRLLAELDAAELRAVTEQRLARAHRAALALGGADHLIKLDGLNFVVRNGRVTTVLLACSSGERARVLAGW